MKKAVVIAAGLVLFGGAVWAYFLFRADPQVARVQQMRTELMAADAPPEQRREKWESFRGEIEKLSEDQRRQVFEGMRADFEKRMTEELDAFFAMSPADQTAYLDRRIKEDDQRAKEWEKRRAERAQSQPTGGAGQNQAQRPGGWGGWQNMSSADRTQRRKQFLDHTDPAQRAKWSEFRRLMNERRKQLGLPPGRGPWGR